MCRPATMGALQWRMVGVALRWGKYGCGGGVAVAARDMVYNGCASKRSGAERGRVAKKCGGEVWL